MISYNEYLSNLKLIKIMENKDIDNLRSRLVEFFLNKDEHEEFVDFLKSRNAAYELETIWDFSGC